MYLIMKYHVLTDQSALKKHHDHIVFTPFRIWGRSWVLQWPPQPHHQCPPRPLLQRPLGPTPSQPAARWRAQLRPLPGVLWHAGQGVGQQPLDRGGWQWSERPVSETGLQLGHVPQLPTALRVHDSHKSLVTMTAVTLLSHPSAILPWTNCENRVNNIQ